MDTRTADKLATDTRQLLACPAWEGWFVPWIRTRQEKIRQELTANLTEADTAKLREEHRVLDDLPNLPIRQRDYAVDCLKAIKGDDAED